MKPELKGLSVYAAKCITAVAIVSGLARLFRYEEIIWPLVSAILVLTPDSQEAIPLAVVRIGANLIASATSLVFLLAGRATFISLSVALTLTIFLCALCRLIDRKSVV